MTAFNIIVCILIVFTAIALLCAVRIALWPSPARCDPFFHPFGDVPGFSDQQLREMARRANDRIARDPLRRSFVTRDLNSGRSTALREGRDADGVGMGVASSPRAPAASVVRSFFNAVGSTGGRA